MTAGSMQARAVPDESRRPDTTPRAADRVCGVPSKRVTVVALDGEIIHDGDSNLAHTLR